MTLSNNDASFAEQIHSHIAEIRAILSIEKNNPDSPLHSKKVL